ncbi:hypothetical protein LJC32_05880, partial [Oscillospiraceae bacterium OttesenSCG-928-F05]|nr:hypothetical protein [Oscillospiraceae bacterium OttesenSCG-928-F05]
MNREHLAERALTALTGYVAGVIFAFSLAWSLVHTHGLIETLPPGRIFLYTALLLLALRLLFAGRWMSLATTLVSLGLLGWRLYTSVESREGIVAWAGDFFPAVWAFFTGNEGLAEIHRLTFCLILVFLPVLLARLTACRLQGSAFMIFAALAIYIAEWTLGHRGLFGMMALTAAAVTAVFSYTFARKLYTPAPQDDEDDDEILYLEGAVVDEAHGRVFVPRASLIALCVLPLALVAAGFATSVIPDSTEHLRLQPVVTLVDDVADFVGQYAGFSRPHRAYTIAEAGYPDTRSTLGGPVEPTANLILTLESDGTPPALLRGAVRDVYTGSAWLSGDSHAYRFDGLMWRDKRAEVFGLDRPEEALLAALEVPEAYPESPVSILLKPYRALTAYFTPEKPGALDGDTIAYFNDLGELYPKEALNFMQSYGVEGRAVTPASP